MSAPEITVMSAPGFEITPEIAEAGRRYGAVYRAAPDLCDADQILAFIIRNSMRSKREGSVGGVGEYFENGKLDADQLERTMSGLNLPPDCKVLEFASGYGRVSRHLKHLSLTAADIHSDAVDFLNERIGVQAVRSTQIPEHFDPGALYDFIFVLSFFSHLPDAVFGRWLGKLTSLLRPGGKLLFTTHGEAAGEKSKILRDCLDSSSGYGFLPDATDQPQLESALYGSSIVTPSYVIPQIYRHTDARIESFAQARWWVLQDEWIISARPAEVSAHGRTRKGQTTKTQLTGESAILAKANTALAANVASLGTLLNSMTVTNGQLEAKLGRMTASRDQLQAELDHVTASRDLFEAELGRVIASRDLFQAELGRMTASRDLFEAELGRMTASRDLFQEELARMTASRDLFQDELGHMIASRDLFQEELGRMTASRDLFQEELGRMTASRDLFQEELGRMTISRDQFQAELDRVIGSRDQ